MNAAAQSIAHASGTTSPIASRPPASERELLEREAEIARAGLRQCIDDLQAEAREVADLRRLVRWKPWWALGVGIGGGLVAGGMLAGAVRRDGDPSPAFLSPGAKDGSKLGALLAPLLLPVVLGAGKSFLRRLGVGGGGDHGLLPPDLRMALGPLAVRLMKNLR